MKEIDPEFLQKFMEARAKAMETDKDYDCNRGKRQLRNNQHNKPEDNTGDKKKPLPKQYPMQEEKTIMNVRVKTSFSNKDGSSGAKDSLYGMMDNDEDQLEEVSHAFNVIQDAGHSLSNQYTMSTITMGTPQIQRSFCWSDVRATEPVCHLQ